MARAFYSDCGANPLFQFHIPCRASCHRKGKVVAPEITTPRGPSTNFMPSIFRRLSAPASHVCFAYLTRHHVKHSWIGECAARHHCSLFGRTKLRRQLAGSRHYIVDHRAAIFLPSGGTRYLALTFSACCTDFGISTQRNPRWFVPVVTSPFPRVPTMYREQY